MVLSVVAATIAVYLGLIRPWQHRRGATSDEAARPMPGEGILRPGAPSTTGAITIAVRNQVSKTAEREVCEVLQPEKRA